MRILLADRQDITRMGLVHIIQQMNVGDKEEMPGIPRAPRYSGYHYQSYSYLYGALTLYGLTFQTGSSSNITQISWSYYPDNAETLSVWATPRSLATTCGITIVFSSCGY